MWRIKWTSMVTVINIPDLIQKTNPLISLRLGLVRWLSHPNFPQNAAFKLITISIMLSRGIKAKPSKNNTDWQNIFWMFSGCCFFFNQIRDWPQLIVTHSLFEVSNLSVCHFSQRFIFCTLHWDLPVPHKHTKSLIVGKSAHRRHKGIFHNLAGSTAA